MVAVVIVTYNSADCIESCLAGIRRSDYDGEISITVVDNASTDGTVRVLRAHEAEIALIENKENLYYARGCNQGAAASGGEYLLFLNPDVRVRNDTIRTLAEYLQTHDDVAAVAPKLVFPDGRVQQSVRQFPTYATLWSTLTGLAKIIPNHALFGSWRVDLSNVAAPVDIDQPMASCFLVRRSVWTELGGFDERYPMFFNDVDLCHRIKQTGRRIVYLPDAVATHQEGGSVRRVMPRMIWFSHAAFLRYLRSHHRSRWDDLKYLFTAPVFYGVAAVRWLYWRIRPSPKN